MADLHTHSTASDGLLAPAALVEEAVRRGLRAIALTDHDTVDGLAEAIAAGARRGVEVVPGVELGTDARPHEVHLLGYFVDRRSRRLREALAAQAEHRRQRAARMVERLNELGIEVTLAEVLALAGSGTVGRPHLARAIVARGAAADVAEAFDRYLASGRPAYVHRQALSPEAAVALVRAAGGVPVLAHPLTTGDPEATVARLLPAGLGGIEVDYGEYDAAARAALRALADRHGLIATGGSDYHGPGHKHGRELGGAVVSAATVDLLRRATRSTAGAEPT